ncbi:MAG: PEGA domain-containing protein [Lachnospiraceae bacterium]|nr:PEGA domain-containing protein [Lachnospiraceae bacterium]
MMNRNKIQKMIKPLLCGLCLILTGCSAASMARESTFESAYENGEQEEPVNIYTSAASAVIKSVNAQDQTISVYLIERKENRTLSYDGATMVQDKYGSAMSMVQLKAGDVADLTYNSELDRAGSVVLSGDAWSYEGVVKYNLDAGKGSAAIGDETYSIDETVLAFSDGRPIETDEIIHQDVLTFRGKGHSIISITVDKGHGYLDLVNDEAVLGGWIEIGQTVISQIAPDMLFTVPEGNYSVRLTGAGIDETREITIERNKETVLDLGDIEIPEPENGVVKFEIIPETAVVYVDDARVDTTYPVRLSMGLHQVTAKASGYDTLSEYFQVEKETTTVKMNLTEAATVSGNNIAPSVSEGSRITIEAPSGVDVYQDNLYKGIAPVTYTKTAGEHTITLRRTGYITRSYSITVPDDNQDVTYSFPELDPENTEATSKDTLGDYTVSGNTLIRNTVSGNSVSGNTVSGNSASDNSIIDRK